MTLIIITALLMLASALVACIKPGEKDNICDYGYIEK